VSLTLIANHIIGGGGGGGDAEEEKEAEEEVEEAPPAVDVSNRMRDHEHIMCSFCLYNSYYMLILTQFVFRFPFMCSLFEILDVRRW
jgi:hypothetical protein